MTVTRKQLEAARDYMAGIVGKSIKVNSPEIHETIRTVLQSALSATDTNVATKTPDTAALDALAKLDKIEKTLMMRLDSRDKDKVVEDIETIRAALTRPSVGWMPTHRHKKRGTEYQVIGDASLQTEFEIEEGTMLRIYVGDDGKIWARPCEEFADGRFEEIPAAPKGGE